MSALPFDATITEHARFEVPLATDNVLTEIELAAIRAGIPLPWDQERFEAQR